MRAMVGRDLSSLFPHAPATPGVTRLEVARTCAARAHSGRSPSDLRAGEIVGLYGIVGAGRSDLAEALFGLAPADDGEILIDGRPATIRSAGGRARGRHRDAFRRTAIRMGLAPMLSVSDQHFVERIADAVNRSALSTARRERTEVVAS